MGGKTSSKVKNANTSKNYDKVNAFVPKGMRKYYQDEARKAKSSSLNAYIWECVDRDIERRKSEEFYESERGTDKGQPPTK